MQSMITMISIIDKVDGWCRRFSCCVSCIHSISIIFYYFRIFPLQKFYIPYQNQPPVSKFSRESKNYVDLSHDHNRTNLSPDWLILQRFEAGNFTNGVEFILLFTQQQLSTKSNKSDLSCFENELKVQNKIKMQSV